jgi:hypothetical protein
MQRILVGLEVRAVRRERCGYDLPRRADRALQIAADIGLGCWAAHS